MIKKILFLITLFILLSGINPIDIEAVWFKISSTPIVPVGPIDSWDQYRVGSASITFDGSIFKMWYEGNNGLTWRIGYATSEDGINWIKNSNFVVDKIDNFNNANVHDPKVIYKNNTYQMWFSGSNPDIRNIHINYSESSDGISWNPINLNIMTASLIWENDLGISFPYTIYQNNQYKMWYAARGSFNSSTRWRIGYATSPDGLSWTKNPLPVIQATESWEGVDVANPSVLFDETTGIYEMFYHGDFGIGRATSTDGINWVKDPANPILTPTLGTFDGRRVFNPYVLKKDGIYYMWYTGVNNDNQWQIGLATSEPLPPLPTSTPTPTPTPSPTPTPTVTPSLTPTATPSPTPTPNQPFSPIVFIPGLGASWNPKDIFACSINSSGVWEMAPYVTVYNRLIKTLTDNAGLALNQDLYIYTYDWRQPLDKQAENFKKFIGQILASKPEDTKIHLVGHSLGGLVIRSYLSNNPADHHILSALTIGTPHLGAVAAYPIWEKGEIAVNDMTLQVAINQVINHCRIIRTFVPPKKFVPVTKLRSSKDVIQYLVPVIKQLLPTFDYLRQNGILKSTSSLKMQNDWIPAHPFPQDTYNVDFSTLSGNDRATLRFLDVVKPTIRESVFGEWIDGKPAGSETSNFGDGAVLNFSSQVGNANNEIMIGNHGDIVASAAGIEKILNFLGLSGVPVAAAILPPEEVSRQALTISLDQEAKITITDPLGKLKESKDNIFVSFNPQIGLYRLEIIPRQTAQAFLHLSEIKSGKDPQTQSFSVSLIKNRPQRFYLIYNPASSDPVNIIPL